jgi:hypothetical protein
MMLIAAILGLAASAVATASETVAPPAAVIHRRSVTHPGAHLTVRVPNSATYVGSDRFDLYGIADAEVQLFVEADANKRVRKLYWIQFESYWPSKPDLTHNYTGDRREHHWGTTVWVRAEPSATSSPAKPGSDSEHVRALLKRAGYTRPEALMSVRMVQLLDDPKGTGHGRRELMFIYSEDPARSGKTLAELTSDGKPNASWTPIEKGLVERAARAFSVERK